MKGWKWAEKLGVQVGTIIALVFAIWIVAETVLLNARRLVALGKASK